MYMNKLVIGLIVFMGIIGAGMYYKSTLEEPALPARPVDVSEISPHADNVPPSVAEARTPVENKTVTINLRATQVVAELADGTTYEYWTFNNQVPGPLIRVMEGDTVKISLSHEHAHSADHQTAGERDHSIAVSSLLPAVLANGDEPHEEEHMMNAEEMEHAVAGHGEHSIDLHAVLGPGGGAEYMRTAPNQTKTFQFTATRPGIYVYHCASPHVPSHIANGMYGMILVEPQGGLPPVDREFYVMQGEFYTTGKVGAKGHQELDKEKLLAEQPEYVVFNGRMGALTGNRALRANVGEKIRIFFGVSGQLASNFHIIGGILDSVYPEGDIVSSPLTNVQTTLVPGGGAVMVEFTAETPGKYLLVDHALSRAIDRGALGELLIEGMAEAEIIRGL
jgi:nitrite reductase (NO-forming)